MAKVQIKSEKQMCIRDSIYASSDGLHAVPLKKESNWLLDYDSNE